MQGESVMKKIISVFLVIGMLAVLCIYPGFAALPGGVSQGDSDGVVTFSQNFDSIAPDTTLTTSSVNSPIAGFRTTSENLTAAVASYGDGNLDAAGQSEGQYLALESTGLSMLALGLQRSGINAVPDSGKYTLQFKLNLASQTGATPFYIGLGTLYRLYDTDGGFTVGVRANRGAGSAQLTDWMSGGTVHSYGDWYEFTIAVDIAAETTSLSMRNLSDPDDPGEAFGAYGADSGLGADRPFDLLQLGKGFNAENLTASAKLDDITVTIAEPAAADMTGYTAALTDFENFTVGKIADGTTVGGITVDAPASNSHVFTDYAYTLPSGYDYNTTPPVSNKFLTVEKISTGNAVIYTNYADAVANSDQYTMRFRFRYTMNGTFNLIETTVPSTAVNGLCLEVNGGKLYYFDGDAGMAQAADLTTDTWYEITMDMDKQAGTADLYLDGALLAEDIRHRITGGEWTAGANTFGGLTIRANNSSTSGQISLDDIRVTANAGYLGPDWTTDAELTFEADEFTSGTLPYGKAGITYTGSSDTKSVSVVNGDGVEDGYLDIYSSSNLYTVQKDFRTVTDGWDEYAYEFDMKVRGSGATVGNGAYLVTESAVPVADFRDYSGSGFQIYVTDSSPTAAVRITSENDDGSYELKDLPYNGLVARTEDGDSTTNRFKLVVHRTRNTTDLYINDDLVAEDIVNPVGNTFGALNFRTGTSARYGLQIFNLKVYQLKDYITSDSLVIDSGMVHGFKAMTAEAFLAALVPEQGMTLALVQTDGETPVDSTAAVEKGMRLLVYDTEQNGRTYTLGEPSSLYSVECYFKGTEEGATEEVITDGKYGTGTVTAKLLVQNYQKETPVFVIMGLYKGNSLEAVNTASAILTEDGEVTVSLEVTDTENTEIRVIAIDSAEKLQPLLSSAVVLTPYTQQDPIGEIQFFFRSS